MHPGFYTRQGLANIITYISLIRTLNYHDVAGNSLLLHHAWTLPVQPGATLLLNTF